MLNKFITKVMPCIIFLLCIVVSIMLLIQEQPNKDIEKRINLLEIKIDTAIDAINRQQLARFDQEELSDIDTLSRRMDMVESQIQGLQFTMDTIGKNVN